MKGESSPQQSFRLPPKASQASQASQVPATGELGLTRTTASHTCTPRQDSPSGMTPQQAGVIPPTVYRFMAPSRQEGPTYPSGTQGMAYLLQQMTSSGGPDITSGNKKNVVEMATLPRPWAQVARSDGAFMEAAVRQAGLQASWSSRNDDDHTMSSNAWQTVTSRGKKRRYLGSPPQTKPAQSASAASPLPHRRTVILRPTRGINISNLHPKSIHMQLAAVAATVTSREEYAVRIQTAANVIAVDVWNPTLIPKFLALTRLGSTDMDMALEVQPYEAMSRGQVRGVIYGSGMDDSPSELLQNLECDTNKIISARPMGRDSKAALITFEGTKLPRKVYYHRCVKYVARYTPRVVACSKCHAIGHKADICPETEARCDRCGRLHDGMTQCQDPTPQCRHCGGPHLGTAPECPRRLQANKSLRSTITRTPPEQKERKQPQRRRQEESTTVHVPIVLPPSHRTKTAKIPAPPAFSVPNGLKQPLQSQQQGTTPPPAQRPAPRRKRRRFKKPPPTSNADSAFEIRPTQASVNPTQPTLKVDQRGRTKYADDVLTKQFDHTQAQIDQCIQVLARMYDKIQEQFEQQRQLIREEIRQAVQELKVQLLADLRPQVSSEHGSISLSDDTIQMDAEAPQQGLTPTSTGPNNA